MTQASGDQGSLCALYVDMGTTNTRVWLMNSDRTVASVSDTIGIRDAARDGGLGIRSGLGKLIGKARRAAEPCDPPEYIVAAGMIGSNLGLAEVPHLQPPTGIGELIAAAQWHHFPDVCDLPFLLVPGVRSGPANVGVTSIHQADVMRGEETLCAGLVKLRIVLPPAVVLNLGSHWKAIQLDGDGRIQSSVTSLSGELFHAVQAHTVLAGSVPRERPQNLSPEWIEAGMAEQRRAGLARALFCTRLLDLARQGSPEDRLAFIVGAFIASDLDGLLARGIIAPHMRVALVGHSAVSQAWQTALSRMQITATMISREQAETALLHAMQRILVGALPSLESALQRGARE